MKARDVAQRSSVRSCSASRSTSHAQMRKSIDVTSEAWATSIYLVTLSFVF
jgi:hypothetical protein